MAASRWYDRKEVFKSVPGLSASLGKAVEDALALQFPGALNGLASVDLVKEAVGELAREPPKNAVEPCTITACIYIYTHVYFYMYVYICVCLFIYAHICMYIYM